MKSIERLLRVFVLVAAIALSASACTGTSNDIDDAASAPTPNPQDATDAAEPADEPTPSPPPTAEPAVASDDDRIAAAIAALNTNGTRDLDLFAWDILDTSVRDDGDVTLTLCGWTGDTVFDKVYSSIWAINTTTPTPTATEITTAPTVGECLNTQLIESALATIEEFEEYWVEILEDPAQFANDQRSQSLLTPAFLASAESAAAIWSDDGISFAGLSEGAPLQSSLAAPLYRRYRTEDNQRLEIAVCRSMDPTYGAYIGGVLVDDSRQADDPGLHALNATVLTPVDGLLGEWVVALHDSLVWSDCLSLPDWPAGASAWRPEVADFAQIES